MKKPTLEQSCIGFAKGTIRQCMITGYDCKATNKRECPHYQFIMYRLQSHKYQLLNTPRAEWQD